MRKEIITAISRDGLDCCTSVFVFTVYDESIDLVEKIKEAAAAFINTDIGLLEYQHNCKNFNWGDFFSAIPNSFLRPYGFEKDTSDVAQYTVNFDEQLATEEDLHFSNEKWEILKRELFMNGAEALEDFIGTELDKNLEKDSIEKLLDEISDQIPDEELYKFYSKYCLEHQVLCEQRKQQLIKAIDDAEAYIEKQEEWEDECDKNIKKIIYEIIAEKESVPLENFYFTFSGADMRFPYQNGYLVVRAENEKEAFRKFRFRYPDPYLNCLCCASWYSQEKWEAIDVDMGICHEIIE